MIRQPHPDLDEQADDICQKSFKRVEASLCGLGNIRLLTTDIELAKTGDELTPDDVARPVMDITARVEIELQCDAGHERRELIRVFRQAVAELESLTGDANGTVH